MAVLTSLQKELLNSFAAVADSQQFYLTGGTALAEFYLQHRKSLDLDFFTSVKELLLPFSFQLEEHVKKLSATSVRQRGLHSFVELAIKKGKESTLIHLAYDAPFRFKPTKEFPEFPGVRIDNLTDIASNKLLALFQRATLRDFVDIYFLVKENHFTREKLMSLAKEKDPGFDLYWLGVAFEQINTFPADSSGMLLLLKPCSTKDLQIFFNAWREEIAKKLA